MSEKYRIKDHKDWWRRILPLLVTLHLFTFSLFLLSCGNDRKTFLLEGTFKGFSQGELYIYGVNGSHRLDTISVVKGRIHYEITLEDTVTLSLVFPNFSELPIFAEPRAEVEIEGDASHLKETRISGTETNEEMTKFRLQAGGMTPPEATKAAEAYIREHPESPVALYLLNKYFTQIPEPDNKKCIAQIPNPNHSAMRAYVELKMNSV